MTQTLEREVTQIHIRLDEVVSTNAEHHRQLGASVADVGKVANRLEQGQTKLFRTVKLGAVLLSIAPLALQAYTSIRSAYATEHTIQVAREATRQEFDRLKSERATELQTVADLAAKSAVRMIIMPEEVVTNVR